VRRIAVHPPLAHGAVPSTQPSADETKVTETGAKLARADPPDGAAEATEGATEDATADGAVATAAVPLATRWDRVDDAHPPGTTTITTTATTMSTVATVRATPILVVATRMMSLPR
jgi:hypothetical protein